MKTPGGIPAIILLALASPALSQDRSDIYAFTPRAFVNAFIQYNADTHLVSSNLRFDLIHRPLSDLYIVYNDTRDTLGAQLRERAFIVKLTNLFDF
jgi:hypothetical protein